MAKKIVRRTHRHVVHHKVVKAKSANNDNLMVVRGWMFVVAFALMLGIGAIVGTFFSNMLNENVPTVAGVQISK